MIASFVIANFANPLFIICPLFSLSWYFAFDNDENNLPTQLSPDNGSRNQSAK